MSVYHSTTQVKNLDINQTIVENGIVHYLVDVDNETRTALFQMGTYPGTPVKKNFDDFVTPFNVMIRGFEHVSEEFCVGPEGMRPKSGTIHSAAYDFFSTVKCIIAPHQTIKIYTNIKAYMQVGEVLLLDVRSSIGIKKHLMLSNTIGVIDDDFYSNTNNDGNICISLFNYGDDAVIIDFGERIAQGWFTFALPSDNGIGIKLRLGGIGSTGK